MATSIVAPRRASLRASRAVPTQHEAGAHNALSLAMLHLTRGNVAAAQRKASQALASLQHLQEPSPANASRTVSVLPDAKRAVLERIARQAASKGYRLHRCTALTGATADLFMVQRGPGMRFFESVESLEAGLSEMPEYFPRSRRRSAEEGAQQPASRQTNGGANHG
ncbi:MAG: hypothetical protein EOO27_01000 [Comamonadaceae bacterium]|nr:MAG: hypothetical protein EOO27_01000 [Comamonadaceae bacterium]